MQFRCFSFAILMLAIFSALTFSAAQSTPTVPVTVQVTDAIGDPIPSARIELLPFPSSSSSEFETNEHGLINLNLKQGAYCATFSSQGFVALKGHIDVRGPLTIPLKLNIGECTECAEVSPLYPDNLAFTIPGYFPGFLYRTDLKSMPRIEVEVRNSSTQKVEVYSGVTLFNVLAKIRARLDNKTSDKPWAEYLIATGANGYQVVIALAEIDPKSHPANVLVADSLDGKPLNGQNGPFKLVVGYDRNSARSVPKLVSIEMRSAE